MNGFLVLVRYDLRDIPIRIFDEHGEHAAVNLAAESAANYCSLHAAYPKPFAALEVRQWSVEVPIGVAVLRIADGVVSEMVDEFYTGADDDTDDDDDECDCD
jgi:DNA helicase HerA-like ATPase